MINWQINLGDLVSLVLALAAVIGVYTGMKNALVAITTKLDLMAGRLLNVENELRDHSKTIAIIDRQDERIAAIQRENAQERIEGMEWRNWVRTEIQNNRAAITAVHQRIDELHGRD